MQKIQYAIQTHLNMQEMDKLGFDMCGGKSGWIYHAQISDKPLNIQMGSDNDLNLDDIDDDQIINAIVDKFEDLDCEGKLEFVSRLAYKLT